MIGSSRVTATLRILTTESVFESTFLDQISSTTPVLSNADAAGLRSSTEPYDAAATTPRHEPVDRLRTYPRMLALAASLMLVGCTPGAPSPVTPPTAPITASPIGSRPTAVALRTPAPTPTASPTQDPARLTFSSITYNPNACWNADWKDHEGHIVGGIEVKYAITVRNLDAERAYRLWFRVLPADTLTRATDVLTTSWANRSAYADGNGLLIGAPKVDAGDSLSLTWSVLFITAFDVHYRVSVFALAPDVSIQDISRDDIGDRELTVWDGNWTTSTIC